MVKQGLVWATATEDMDALTFGSDVLLRHITFSAARKIPVQEFHLNKVLASLELTKDEVNCINMSDIQENLDKFCRPCVCV